MQPAPGAWAEFRGDLRASLRAWRVAPLLPLISVALFSVSAVPEGWWGLALPVLLWALGWLGTERIWYLRVYRGERIEGGELLRLTRAFFGRYARLALIVAAVWLPFIFWAFGISLGDPGEEGGLSGPAEWLIPGALTMAVDFVLTFVTPALAFSTPSVGEAFRLGVGMLRDHWPHTAWYALLPPLAVVVLVRLFDPSPTVAGQLAISAVTTLLNVWFKGATAAFYLRRAEVGRDGAAFAKRLEVAAREHGNAPRAY